MVNISKLHYTEITKWECDYCFKTYDYFGTLKSHLKKIHNVKTTVLTDSEGKNGH